MDFANMIGHHAPSRDLVGGIRVEADASASTLIPPTRSREGAWWPIMFAKSMMDPPLQTEDDGIVKLLN